MCYPHADSSFTFIRRYCPSTTNWNFRLYPGPHFLWWISSTTQQRHTRQRGGSTLFWKCTIVTRLLFSEILSISAATYGARAAYLVDLLLPHFKATRGDTPLRTRIMLLHWWPNTTFYNNSLVRAGEPNKIRACVKTRALSLIHPFETFSRIKRQLLLGQ